MSRTSPSSLFGANPPKSDDGATVNYVLYTKGFWASGLGQVRPLTAATVRRDAVLCTGKASI